MKKFVTIVILLIISLVGVNAGLNSTHLLSGNAKQQQAKINSVKGVTEKNATTNPGFCSSKNPSYPPN